jgi:hypothetical protein
MLLHETRIQDHEAGTLGASLKKIRSHSMEVKVKLNFLFFDEVPIILSMKRNNETVYRTYQEHTFNHVQAIKEQLLGNTTHPSDGKTATHISWVVNQITEKIKLIQLRTTVNFVY